MRLKFQDPHTDLTLSEFRIRDTNIMVKWEEDMDGISRTPSLYMSMSFSGWANIKLPDKETIKGWDQNTILSLIEWGKIAN